MAPLGLDIETDGSILVPSDRASLYSLKLTVGKASTHGTLPFTRLTDSVGPMAKSADDLASMLDILTPIKIGMHRDAPGKSFNGMRIGFLDPIEWAPGTGAVRPNEDYTLQVVEEIVTAVDRIESAGADVKRNIKLRRFSDEDDKMFTDVSSTDYVNQLAEFLKGMQGTSVKPMQDLVKFNNDHSSDCFPPGSPGQEILENALKTRLSPTTYNEYRDKLRKNNQDLGIDSALRDNEIDLIIGAPTGRLATVAALAGYLVGTVPLGYARFNGRPFGMAIIPQANAELIVLSAMSAWEATFPERQPPPQLVDWDERNPEK